MQICYCLAFLLDMTQLLQHQILTKQIKYWQNIIIFEFDKVDGSPFYLCQIIYCQTFTHNYFNWIPLSHQTILLSSVLHLFSGKNWETFSVFVSGLNPQTNNTKRRVRSEIQFQTDCYVIQTVQEGLEWINQVWLNKQINLYVISKKQKVEKKTYIYQKWTPEAIRQD